MIEQLLPPFLFQVFKRLKYSILVRRYLWSGKIPWVKGYGIYKLQMIESVLKNEDLLERFRSVKALPPGYGKGIDERCVEYPWLFSQLQPGNQVLLDAGSVLNESFLLDRPVLRGKVIHILTLAPEAQSFWHKGISYLYHDLRNIPIRDDTYDTIVCLSTLEHVGCDNRPYTHQETHREDQRRDFVCAIKELRRVLKTGGTLFLSVPFGRYRHLGTLQQFDTNLLAQAIEAFGPDGEVRKTFFRYDATGWSLVDETACAECDYVERASRPPWPEPYPPEPDMAAAARAVACVRLTKSGGARLCARRSTTYEDSRLS